jgi:hypothetical protein
VSEALEGEGILPEAVEHSLDDVLPFVDVDLVVEERVFGVLRLAAEIVVDGLGGELGFFGAEEKSEGEDGIDEAVRIADAEKSVADEIFDQ